MLSFLPEFLLSDFARGGEGQFVADEKPFGNLVVREVIAAIVL